jgi:hypothetical protein
LSTSSILLLLHPLVQIFSLWPCSQTPSVCDLSIMWKTKFYTHTKQMAEFQYHFRMQMITFT